MTEAALTGPADRSLTIGVAGYVNDSADNDFDANWLTVAVAARDGDISWEASGRALLSWELHELAAWVRARADGQPSSPVFSGFTGLLQFEADPEGGTGLVAVLTEELAAPGADRHDGSTIVFEPGTAELSAFADGVRALADATHIRPVEPDGYARKLLGGS